METENLIASLSSEAVPIRPMGSPWRLTAKWLLGFIAYVVLVLVTLESPRDDILLQLNQTLFALELLALAAMGSPKSELRAPDCLGSHPS